MNRKSRVAIPKDVCGGWMASLAMWHLNDAFEDHRDSERPPEVALPDEEVRDMREARDNRIITQARASQDRYRQAMERLGRSLADRSSSGE